MVDLSISIVNYNTKDLLRKCLESIYESIEKINFEVFVFDNNSNDGTAEMLKEEFPQVKLIENHQNIGLSKANNKVFQSARGKYLLLLDSDTIVLSSALHTMSNFLDTYSEVGVVGGKILNPDYTVQGTARSFPTPINAFFGRRSRLTRAFPDNRFSRKYLTCLSKDSTEPFEVDWVSAACLMFRRKIIEQIGLMDEDFFVYWVDADWCKRIKDAGWKIYYLPQAKVIHMERYKTGQKVSNKMIIDFHKGVYHFYRKHYAKSILNPMSHVALIGLIIRGTILLMVNAFRSNKRWGKGPK